MTREEAIKALEILQSSDIEAVFESGNRLCFYYNPPRKAIEMAIKALEQQNELFRVGLLKDCESCKAQTCNLYNVIADLTDLIDKYKAESEGKNETDN